MKFDKCFHVDIPWAGYRWYWWLLPWMIRLAWRRRRCARMLRNFGKRPYTFPQIKAAFPTCDIREVIVVHPLTDVFRPVREDGHWKKSRKGESCQPRIN